MQVEDVYTGRWVDIPVTGFETSFKLCKLCIAPFNPLAGNDPPMLLLMRLRLCRAGNAPSWPQAAAQTEHKIELSKV